MIETVLGALRRAGVDPTHLHEEKYFTATDPTPEAAPAPPETSTPSGRGPGSITLKAVPRTP
jgi:hypothetical protein